jgi:uncharacterized membrane protein YdjX (TVP38/TMEM64 family)
MDKGKILSLIGILLLLLGGYMLLSNFSYDELKEVAQAHRLRGAILLGFIMFGTTVIAPLTSLPLVPVIAPFLGPFTTGLACYVGWVLGAIAAFLIGRHYGQAFVSRYVNMEPFQKYERYFGDEANLFLIITLRMVVPVDILSYVIGIFSGISFKIYTIATMIGVFWFSFAFAYLGDSLFEKNYVLLLGLGVASMVILFTSWWYVRKRIKNK